MGYNDKIAYYRENHAMKMQYAPLNLRCCLVILFIAEIVLLAGCNSREQANNEQGMTEYEVTQAIDLAQTAYDKCYNEKDLEECARLSELESTIMELCNQGDEAACETLRTVGAMKTVTQMEQNIGL
jgi:hypothetical protein